MATTIAVGRVHPSPCTAPVFMDPVPARPCQLHPHSAEPWGSHHLTLPHMHHLQCPSSHCPCASDRRPGTLRRRDAGKVSGPLTIASNACPALLELHLGDCYVDQPAAPLAHLSRLILTSNELPPDGAQPLLRLDAAAPRLEVLDCCPAYCDIAAAAEGHPCLRELRLGRAGKAWLDVIPQLPALSNLALEIDFEPVDGEAEGPADRTALLLGFCGLLVRLERLSHLRLELADPSKEHAMPAHELLAAVGAALGSRLRSLTLGVAQMPRGREDAERTLYILPAFYPLLEVLTLQLHQPKNMEASAAEALSGELLPAAGVVATLCPALREVRVEVPLLWRSSFQKATWLRPRA